MASGTINGSCDNSRYILTCEWTSTANTSANTSSVTAKVYLNGNGYTTSSSYWSCVINGTTVTSNKSADIGGKTLLGSRTWTVNHNNDGTASVGISFSYSNGLSSSGTYTTKTGSGSATVRLDTIARGSSMSLSRSSATIGSDSVTVNITRNSSAYKHKVKLILGGTTYLLAENVDTSYTFTPSMSYCNKIPNSTSGTATIKVETLTGTNGSWIADTTKTITLNVPSSVVPSVGISVTANNQTSGVNVAGKTTFTVKPTNASGSYSSTIKSYSITGGHLNSTSSSGATTGTLTAGDYTFVVKVTDSRGRTAQASQKVTVHAYSSPTISARAFRCNSDGTESSSGTYIAVNFSWEITNLASNNSNTKQYFIQYKTSSASSYTTSVDWTNLSSYSGSMTKVLSQTFSTTSSYNIQLKVKDSFGTTTSTLNVSTISALLNIERNGVGVGKIHENGALDVGGAIYGSGIFKLNGNSKYVEVGTDSSCVYIHNGQSGKNIQLRDDGYLSYKGNWLIGYGTQLYGANSDGENQGVVRISSNGNTDLGDTSHQTVLCSKSAPLWYNGTTYTIYTTGNKPTPADIGAAKALTTANGYQGLTLNDGSTSNWIRTTVNGLIPYQSGGHGSLGTSGWPFANGYINELRCNGIQRPSGDLWLTGNSGNGNVIIQGHCVPSDTTVKYLGTSSKRWHSVWSVNGTLQTSDRRYKAIIDNINNEDCFNMVKNTDVFSYVMLNKSKEEMSEFERVEATLMNSDNNENVQMGIMAQDILDYDCSQYILTYSEYEDEETGKQEDYYGINAYAFASAIMGALKQEIAYREELETKVKTLEDKVLKLEMLVAQLLQN